jgi:hypothetical protein
MIIYFLNDNTQEIENYYAEKEYRDDVLLEIGHLYYEVYFFTIDALEYEMTKGGFFSFPGMIILDNISTENIIKAVVELEKKGFFDKFSGMEVMNQDKRFIHSWYKNKLSSYDMNKIKVMTIN